MTKFIAIRSSQLPQNKTTLLRHSIDQASAFPCPVWKLQNTEWSTNCTLIASTDDRWSQPREGTHLSEQSHITCKHKCCKSEPYGANQVCHTNDVLRTWNKYLDCRTKRRWCWLSQDGLIEQSNGMDKAKSRYAVYFQLEYQYYCNSRSRTPI